MDGVSLPVSTDGRWSTRAPERWLGDMHAHRRQYRQSRFRWFPHDAMHVASQYARGRLEFTTPGHLRALDRSICELHEWLGEIRDALGCELKEARRRCSTADWAAALEVLGYRDLDARIVIGTAHPMHEGADRNPDVQLALEEYPYVNPLTNAWELRQVESLYYAGELLLDDALCDLAEELGEWHSLDNLAALTSDRYGSQLQARIQRQRGSRGGPGDARRAVRQAYPPL